VTTTNTQAAATQAAFYYQNLFAARQVLALLDTSTGVNRVIVELDDAPHVDDVVVLRSDGAIFNQVKYASADSAATLTNADLFSEGPRGPSLWHKLVRGWLAVRAHSPNVEIRLVTNRRLSSQASSIAGVQLPSLETIVGRLLVPCREARLAGTAFEPAADLAAAWQTLRDAAGLTTDFETFVATFHMATQVGSLFEISEEIRGHLQRLTGMLREADTLFDTLLHSVVKAASSPIPDQREFTRERLERILGLTDRRELRHRHDLALPPDYVPFGDISRRIWNTLTRLDSGYLFVRGVAGSGKTVAVTALLQHHPEIHLRYYTYHPQEYSDRSDRVTRTDFYFDLLLQLAQRLPKIYEGPKYPGSDGSENRRIFWTEVYRLVDKGIRPFTIVVDGLDHAARVQPTETVTFLETLPAPDRLPSGLKILLVGQPHWRKYPPWLEDPQRVEIIDMPRMSRGDIDQYLAMRTAIRGDIEHGHELAQELLRKTVGNPLSVWISVNRIAGLTSSEVARALADDDFPGDDVHRYYEQLWRDIEAETYFQARPDYLRRVQALLLVIREPITAEILSTVFADLTLDIASAVSIITRIKPVLAREGAGWVVALNDFRVFLHSQLEEGELRDAHRRIADLYGHSATAAAQRYLTYHLYHAGDATPLWALLQRDRIRTQLIKGHDLEGIRSDLQLGWRAALDKRDAFQIFRIGLLLDEENGRAGVIEEVAELAETWDTDRDVERVLRVFPPISPVLETLAQRIHMIRTAQRLFDRGLREASQTLFDKWAVAPDSLFALLRLPDARYRWQEPATYLSEWFAYWVRVDPRHAARTMEYLWLLFDAFDLTEVDTDALYRYLNHAYPDSLTAVLSLLPAIDAYHFIELALDRGWRIYWSTISELLRRLKTEGYRSEASQFWHDYVKSARGAYLSQILLFGIQLELPTETEAELSRLEPPDTMALWNPGDGPVETWHAFSSVYVRAYFDMSLPQSAFVPVDLDDWAGTDNRYASIVRAVSLTAAATARLHRNPNLVSVQDLFTILAVLFKPEQAAWAFPETVRVKLARYFVESALRSRATITNDLATWIQQQISPQDWPGLPDDLQALAIEILWRADSRGLAQQRLQQMSGTLARLSPEVRVRRLALAASLWALVGHTSEAKRLRGQALLAAVGPGYHEDFQLSEWVRWQLEAVTRRLDTLTYARRFAYYATLLEHETEDSQTMHRALEILLSNLFLAHPRAATDILLDLDNTWKTTALTSSLLKDLARHACKSDLLTDRRGTQACALLLMTAFLSDPLNLDRDEPILPLARTIASRAEAHRDTALAVTLNRRFLPLETIGTRDSHQPEATESLPSSEGDIRNYFSQASELELTSLNYSSQQRAAFALAAQLDTGVAIYFDSIDRLRRSKPTVFAGSPLSILDRLGQLLRSHLPDNELLGITTLLDEHMREMLRYSLEASELDVTPSWAFGDAPDPLGHAIRILVHLLGSACSRVVLEAGRGLGLAADFDLSLVLSETRLAVGSRTPFVDRWLAHIIYGLAARHGVAPAELARSVAEQMDREDIVTQMLLYRACLVGGVEWVSAIPGRAPDEASTEIAATSADLELPAQKSVVSTEDETLGDNYVSSLPRQLAAESRRIAGASGLHVLLIRSLLETEASVTTTRVPYIPTSRCGSMLAEHDSKICSSRIVSRLLRSGQIPAKRRDAVIQVLRGTDPCLLILSPEDMPDAIRRLQDGADNAAWLQGDDLTRDKILRDHGSWRISALHSEQATEHRYESVTTVTVFAHPQVAQAATDVFAATDLRKEMFNQTGTFGMTFDALAHAKTWEAGENRIPIIHVTEVVGGLIPIKQAFLSVCPAARWSRIGLQPTDRELQRWHASDTEIFRFSTWDFNDVTEFSYDTAWVGWGHIWLGHLPGIMSAFPRPSHAELMRLTRIQRAARTGRHQSFAEAALREYWSAERIDATSV
jgi:hypothetical protein